MDQVNPLYYAQFESAWSEKLLYRFRVVNERFSLNYT